MRGQIELIGIVLVAAALLGVMQSGMGKAAKSASVSDYFTKETLSFRALREVCSQWGVYIDQCTDCSCDMCRNNFFSIWAKAYNVPPLLFNSKVIKKKPGSTAWSSSDFEPNSDLCAYCSDTGATMLCAQAVNLLYDDLPEGDDDFSVSVGTNDKLKDSNIKSQLAGDVPDDSGETIDYIGACAAVCNAINQKNIKCESEADIANCAYDSTRLP